VFAKDDSLAADMPMPHFSVSAISPAPSSSSVRAMERRLRRARDHFGTHRHELLVALRLVNRLERDTVAAEYENWIEYENRMCRTMNAIQGGDATDWLSTYCGSCGQEANALHQRALEN